MMALLNCIHSVYMTKNDKEDTNILIINIMMARYVKYNTQYKEKAIMETKKYQMHLPKIKTSKDLQKEASI